jgi:hypothetical protein
MNRDRLEELLWERVDGTISADNLAELEAHLAEHPEPQELEREIAQMAQLLDDGDSVTPPAELRAQIDHALAASVGPKISHRPPTPIAPPRIAGRLPAWVPIAASLVLGVAIGYMLHVSTAVPIDPSLMSGSMTTPASTQPLPAQVFDLGNEIGGVTARQEGGKLIFDIDLVAPVDLSLALQNPGERPTTLYTTGPGNRRLVHDEVEAGLLVVSRDGIEVSSHSIYWDLEEQSP